MTDQQTARLPDAIKESEALIRRHRERGLGEQNTKASLIEPILEALGWAIRNPDEVDREFRTDPRDNPVDYSLTLLRKPRLLVEAKGLGETLADRKWIGQILGYATVAGVEWCVLTDGDEFRLYNAAAASLDAEEKLFCQIKLSETTPETAAKTLRLLSRSNMEENLIDVLWSAYYVDSRVKKALQEMFLGTDKGLVRLIRSKIQQNLTPQQIAESLRRLDLRIESLTPLPDPVARATKAPRSIKGKRKPQKQKVSYPTTLADVISAGLISPPLALFRKYKGTKLEARLLPDGKVEFARAIYDSCSTPAELARGTITGRRMSTNGWTFWRYKGGDGKVHTLDEARQRLLRMKGQVPDTRS